MHNMRPINVLSYLKMNSPKIDVPTKSEINWLERARLTQLMGITPTNSRFEISFLCVIAHAMRIGSRIWPNKRPSIQVWLTNFSFKSLANPQGNTSENTYKSHENTWKCLKNKEIWPKIAHFMRILPHKCLFFLKYLCNMTCISQWKCSKIALKSL